MSQPRLATTLLLLRDSDTASGMEVFMLQRHRRSGFLPNAWVFPGGRLEPSDHLASHPRVSGGAHTLQRLGLPEADGIAMLIAGVRETFEESGIWLGEGEIPWTEREPLNNGEVGLGEVLDRHDATLDLDRVHAWSWWITPEAEPKRYDTRFLLARCDADGEHDNRETVASRWVCPRWAIENATLDVFPMAPPTWWTLRELLDHHGVDSVVQAAKTRPHRPIQPIMRFSGAGMQLILPGHPEHPQPAYPGLPHEVGFEDQCWVATRDGERLSVPHQ